MQPKNTSVFPLIYLGLLPFFACVTLGLLGYTSLPIIGSISQAFMYYTIVIASFMAGSHWGIAISHIPSSMFPFYTSICIAIVVWLFACYANFIFFCVVLSLVFLMCLWVDRILLYKKMLKNDYFLARIKVTILVVLCLATMGAISVWQ